MTKVLVIEDDELIRESILSLLASRGLSAIAAEDGRVGLQLAKQHEPDLILCDLRMPELNGYEVLRALRQDFSTANVPFILLTAETTPEVLNQGQMLGVNSYLNKPFSTAALLAAIAPYLK
jgi:CheY-like chemotaxis protein